MAAVHSHVLALAGRGQEELRETARNSFEAITRSSLLRGEGSLTIDGYRSHVLLYDLARAG